MTNEVPYLIDEYEIIIEGPQTGLVGTARYWDAAPDPGRTTRPLRGRNAAEEALPAALHDALRRPGTLHLRGERRLLLPPRLARTDQIGRGHVSDGGVFTFSGVTRRRPARASSQPEAYP
jgi:hypothetical protein